MVFWVKTILYTNMAIQRKCLKSMGSAVRSGEEFIDRKEAFFEDFFPRAQASEEKIENLLHDTASRVFSNFEGRPKNGLCGLKKNARAIRDKLQKLRI